MCFSEVLDVDGVEIIEWFEVVISERVVFLGQASSSTSRNLTIVALENSVLKK